MSDHIRVDSPAFLIVFPRNHNNGLGNSDEFAVDGASHVLDIGTRTLYELIRDDDDDIVPHIGDEVDNTDLTLAVTQLHLAGESGLSSKVSMNTLLADLEASHARVTLLTVEALVRFLACMSALSHYSCSCMPVQGDVDRDAIL